MTKLTKVIPIRMRLIMGLYLLSISITLLVPLHQPSFLRAAALVAQRQWAAVRTYLVGEYNVARQFWSTPMIDEGASASVFFAHFRPSEDPEKGAPGSSSFHGATHQPEVALIGDLVDSEYFISSAIRVSPDSRCLDRAPLRQPDERDSFSPGSSQGSLLRPAGRTCNTRGIRQWFKKVTTPWPSFF